MRRTQYQRRISVCKQRRNMLSWKPANCSCQLIVCTSRSKHYDGHLVCGNDCGGTTLLWPKILNMHRLYCTVRWLRISVRQQSCLSRIGCFTHTSRTTHTLKVGWLKLSYTSQLKLSYTSYQSFYCLWRHIGSDSLCEGLIAEHDQLHMRNLNTCQQASLFIQAMQTSTLRVRSRDG